MWWDWSEITLLDSVLFSIVSIMTLYLVGWGTIKLICAVSKKTDIFCAFDFYQKISFRIFFGFAFILFFNLIFSVFNIPFWISTFAIVLISLMGIVATRKSFALKWPEFNIKKFSMLILILIILLAAIFLLSMAIRGSYGSTNDDAAYHTLLTRIILDNPNVLVKPTAQPYADFRLGYPLGSQELCAFFVTLLNVNLQKIVIMLSVVLPVLIALSFYSTTKCLFDNKPLSILALLIGAFFTIGLSWIPVSWGGLPFLCSLYISISGIGLIFTFLKKQHLGFFGSFLLGLIFFMSIETYPSSILVLSLWILLVLFLRLTETFHNQNSKTFFSSLFTKTNIFAFFLPLLFNIPYLYYIYSDYFAGTAHFNALALSPNPFSDIMKTHIGFNWLFDIPALSSFFSQFGLLLSLAPLALIITIILSIPKLQKKMAQFLIKQFVQPLILLYSLFLILMTYLTLTVYLQVNLLLNLFDPERIWEHLFIPGVILTASVVFLAFQLSYSALKQLLKTKKNGLFKPPVNKVLAVILLGLLIFGVGFSSVPIINDQYNQYVRIGVFFNTYQTINQSDVSLMNWITENVPLNDHILVSAGDSGQYVTAITQRQTISIYNYLANYSDLMAMLTSNSSDLRAVPLLVEYNVSYIYIGSIASTFKLQDVDYRHFNASQFLSTPYFTLTKEVGNAWLFRFNASAALTAYSTYGVTD